jgi:hypothetical protein
VLQRAEFGKLDVKDPIPRLDLTGTRVTQWELGEGGDDVRRLKRQIDILKRMDPIDRTVWIAVETQLRNEDSIGRRRSRLPRVEEHRVGQDAAMETCLPALSWLLFGYGTRVWPALVISALLSLFLLAALRNAANVKASDGLLGQINTQCGVLTGKHVALRPYARSTMRPPLPGRARFRSALGSSRTTTVWRTPCPSRSAYSIPLIGAFGEPAWMPMEKQRAEGWSSRSILSVDVGDGRPHRQHRAALLHRGLRDEALLR